MAAVATSNVTGTAAIGGVATAITTTTTGGGDFSLLSLSVLPCSHPHSIRLRFKDA